MKDMRRIMRDLRQLPITGDVRQFAASHEEFPQMMPSRLLALLLAGVLVSTAAVAVDLEKGKEINGTCAACHGDQGAGGKKGEYPRIAGQRVAYIENQLKNFRSRTRVNIPMYPYTQERELSDEDIKDISAYLAGIELSTKMPTFKGTEDALTRLQMVDRVMIIPRAEGNLDRGQAIYQKQCASCHGKTGKGRGMFPMLVGQYTNYLKRQVDLYLKGDRPHDEEGTVGVLNGLKEQDVQDILAYLTSIQEPTE
jgi:cytochrome c553